MERNYTLPPQFIKYSDEVVYGRRLHAFQSALAHVMEQKEDCLVINAPTGAGKTFAFGLASGSSPDNPFGGKVVKSLVLSPTNALISQTFKDLKEEWEARLSVVSFASKDLRTSGSKRAMEIMERIRTNDITVTNPDIITLLIAGRYHWSSRDPRKERQWSDVLKNISVMIFDEYHVYDEEEIAKIVAFMLISRATGNTHIKFVFASATPNRKIVDLLKELGFPCKEIRETMFEDKLEEDDFRASKGKVKLTFTSAGIQDSITNELANQGRTLFLFDRIIGLEKGIARLHAAGFDEFIEYSGFETREAMKREHTGQERFIMATSAAEQGLNMEVNIAHIEPGLFLQNFWQRFGRAARRGQDGTIIVHMPVESIQHLPETINGYEALGEAMEVLMRNKDTYVSKIKDNVTAFLFLVWKKCGNDALKDQVEKAGNGLNRFSEFRAFDQSVVEIGNQCSDQC